MNIELDISVVVCDQRGPNLDFWINQQLATGLRNQLDAITVTVSVDQLRPVNLLWVEHRDKDPMGLSGEIAAQIEQIRFDGLVLPRNLMFDQTFYPNWQFGPAPNFLKQNCYLGYNGIWQLAFPQDPRAWITDFLEQEMFDHAPATTNSAASFDLNSFRQEFLD